MRHGNPRRDKRSGERPEGLSNHHEISAPTDGFVAPTDPETLLLGRLNATYTKKGDKPVQAQASAPVGFVVR